MRRLLYLIGFWSVGVLGTAVLTASSAHAGVAVDQAHRIFALVVGINDYERYPLKGAVNDAKSVHGRLTSSHRGVVRASDSILLLDREADGVGIQRALEDLLARAGPDDVVLFYWAGSAQYAPGLDDLLLYPVETRFDVPRGAQATTIRPGAVSFRNGVLRPASAFGGRFVFIGDMCGGLSEGSLSPNVTVLTSAQPDEEAFDDYRGHGLFTYHLLEALDDPLSDLNGDGRISVEESFSRLYPQVLEISQERQHPSLMGADPSGIALVRTPRPPMVVAGRAGRNLEASSERPRSELVREVQRRLHALGFEAGPIDGVEGERTRRALIEFQEQRGLPPDAKITQALLERLQRAVMERASGPDDLTLAAAEAPANELPQEQRPVAAAPNQASASTPVAGPEVQADSVVASKGAVAKDTPASAGAEAPVVAAEGAAAVRLPESAGGVIFAEPVQASKRLETQEAATDLAGVEAAVVEIPAPTVEQEFATRQERRLALVIGNSNYDSGRLINPANDAQDVATALEQLGFEVMLALDLDRDGMHRAVIDFGRALAEGGVGLFYYAGHAVQVGGRNYLIPLGAALESEDYVPVETVELDQVLLRMGGAQGRLNIVILDSCRDNPFARSFRSLTRGLAATPAPAGTFLAYSTAPGAVAVDGHDRNSPYTKALLNALEIPGLRLEDVFKRVLAAVREETKFQTPWTSASIVGDFYFRPPASDTIKPSFGYGDKDLEAWSVIKGSSDPVDFESYIAGYPDSALAPLARGRLNRLRDTSP